MKPTVTRIVLYCDDDGEHPAIINKVFSDTSVGLTVFPFGKTPLVHVVASLANGEAKVGTWRWPPRTEALQQSLSIEDVLPESEK